MTVAQPSSIPLWSLSAAQLDETARSLALIGIGQAGSSVLDSWLPQVPAGLPRWSYRCEAGDAELARQLGRELSTATVGWRLMVAGPEYEVAAVCGQANRAGAVGAEIRCTVTSLVTRAVYCVHCTSLSHHQLPVGGTLSCPRCDRLLGVRPHFSARHGAYLGVADV